MIGIFKTLKWILVCTAFAQNAVAAPCASVHFTRPVDPDLNAVEIRLVCGDAETEDWKKIPLSQAEFVLKNFLQERGYLHPTFNREYPVLNVDPGEKTKVKNFTQEGGTSKFQIRRKRKVVGEVLTPALMDTVEKWASQELKRDGYACPFVKAEADSDSGEIHLKINPGDILNPTAVLESQEIPGLRPKVLRRYDAFILGNPYNIDNVSLSETRIENEGTVESAHFTTHCEENKVSLTQETVPGLPRLFITGIGFNTEGLFLGKISLKNSRLGTNGSVLLTSLYGSTKDQKFDSDLKWYFLNQPSRFYFNPGIDFEHDNEDPYETLSARVRFAAARTFEFQYFGFLLRSGPVFNQFRTLRGVGPTSSRFVSLESEFLAQNHVYELNRANPIEGYSIALLSDLNSSNFLSDTSVQKLTVRGEYLLNLNNYDPPLFILGFRAGGSTLVSGDHPGPGSFLPQTYLQYLGGSGDLRGYGLKELSATQIGGMTSFYFDTEARFDSLLPFNIEALLFYDLGFLSDSPFSFTPPLYQSPGVGLRWRSPFGTFRTTLAHGYPSDINSHFQFYLSFGEEF